MKIGIHLPQYGRASGSEAIRTVAVRAEELGFADVWVSDHIVQPAAQGYPSPHLFDPFMTLAWAGAVTTRVGLGTSVLVLPQRGALEVANSAASLDALSHGRVILAVGVGWSEGEFDALNRGFQDRGPRTDEIIDVLRACWETDPTTFHGAFHDFDELRVLPKPAHRIPIWVGGGGEPGYRRSVQKGDGFHLIGVTPDEARPVIERLRQDRPEPEFVISLRTGWDPLGMDPSRIVEERDAYEAAGVSHVVAAPWRTDLDSWLGSMEMLAELMDLT